MILPHIKKISSRQARGLSQDFPVCKGWIIMCILAPECQRALITSQNGLCYCSISPQICLLSLSFMHVHPPSILPHTPEWKDQHCISSYLVFLLIVAMVLSSIIAIIIINFFYFEITVGFIQLSEIIQRDHMLLLKNLPSDVFILIGT